MEGPNRKPVANIDIVVKVDGKKNKVFEITSKGSTDPDGDAIVSESWVNRQTQYHHAGKQRVYLALKDARGLWSDWVCKEIKLTGADKPAEITACGAK